MLSKFPLMPCVRLLQGWMTMRLIDADAFLEKMKRTSRYFDVVFDVEDMPTVDAVEVVRCKACKYHNKPPCPMRLSFNWTEDDDFCSYGELKEGAE